MLRLAHKLVAIHGPGRIAQERSGIHLYLPSPVCLELYGESELFKKHLTVNLTKACNGEKWVATCHKESKSYSIEDLLYMPRLEQRGFTAVNRSMTTMTAREEDLFEDEHGVFVPKREMHLIPLRDLPSEHPCMLYLEQRNMADSESLKNLEECLHACYCSMYFGKPYSNIYPGFKNSHGGRLILFCRQVGSFLGYQGRAIEYKMPDSSVYILSENGLRWMPYKNIEGDLVYPSSNLSKYLTAYGTVRQRVLYGYDAAVEFSQRTGTRYCVLVEGPLDIVRVGAPAVAVTGKYISVDQVRLLVSRFDKFIVATDNDDSGNNLAEDAIMRFRSYGKQAERLLPRGGWNKPGDKADVGNMFRADVLDQIDNLLLLM